jgi:hypothetical protein
VEPKQRDAYLRRTYGITLEEFDALVEASGGRCPLCLKPPSTWVVDHDHKTKRVRGVLCVFCNHRVIGRHRDPELFDRAAEYLRNPPVDRVLGERKAPTRKRRRK